jgi:aryl-alcohol dehydrogenase-like predicted oxidoreductase
MNWGNKICLGTAQFGNIYGITNKNKNELDVKEIKKFLILLKKNKIVFIDTALSYKNVDKKLKKTKINLDKFEIITKIPKPKSNEKFYKKKILKKILQSKRTLKIKSFHSILIHNCQDLNTKQAKLIKDTLIELKDKKLTKKIGLSVYNTKDLNFMFKFFIPDLIQVPQNVFDTRFMQSKILNKIFKYNIELHVRSVFLQGLLLIDIKNMNLKFNKWKKLFEKWDLYCKKNKTSKLEAAVNLAMRNKNIKKIVVGFSNIDEFIEFLKIKAKNKLTVPKFLTDNEKNIDKLINPYNWKT